MLLTAVSALCKPAWAEYTEAWADAMLPGEGVDVVVVDVEVVLGVDPPPPEDERDDVDVLGTTTVTVTCGVVLVVVVVPVVPEPGLPPDFGFVGVLPGVVPGWNAAYSTVPAGPE